MWYIVRRQGVTLGRVHLPSGELVAGRLLPTAALRSIEGTVHEGSRAFLQYGLFGPPADVLENDATRTAREALQRAASLDLQLIDPQRGIPVTTSFVNLIIAEEPGIVLLVRILEAGSPRSAEVAANPAGTGEYAPSSE